jgi:peptidoglycan/LPS O-acetylase OafA/YrhL
MFLRFTPTLEGLFDFSLFKVFFAYTNAESYDPPLWTMAYEFFGSFIVFALLALVRAWPARTVVFGALFLALMCAQSYYALFIGGVFIADLVSRLHSWPAAKRAGAALCVGGMTLGLFLTPWFDTVYIAVAMLLVAGIAFCVPLRGAFENRLGDFLGWISYPLYLVQAPAIYAFSVSGLHYLVARGFDDASARFIVGAATVPVAILCAVAFCPVNDLAVKLSRKTGKAFAALFDGFTYSRGSRARGAAPPISGRW